MFENNLLWGDTNVSAFSGTEVPFTMISRAFCVADRCKSPDFLRRSSIFDSGNWQIAYASSNRRRFFIFFLEKEKNKKMKRRWGKCSRRGWKNVPVDRSIIKTDKCDSFRAETISSSEIVVEMDFPESLFSSPASNRHVHCPLIVCRSWRKWPREPQSRRQPFWRRTH